jgi:hypothetical protein
VPTVAAPRSSGRPTPRRRTAPAGGLLLASAPRGWTTFREHAEGWTASRERRRRRPGSRQRRAVLGPARVGVDYFSRADLGSILASVEDGGGARRRRSRWCSCREGHRSVRFLVKLSPTLAGRSTCIGPGSVPALAWLRAGFLRLFPATRAERAGSGGGHQALGEAHPPTGALPRAALQIAGPGRRQDDTAWRRRGGRRWGRASGCPARTRRARRPPSTWARRAALPVASADAHELLDAADRAPLVAAAGLMVLARGRRRPRERRGARPRPRRPGRRPPPAAPSASNSIWRERTLHAYVRHAEGSAASGRARTGCLSPARLFTE